MERDQKRCWLGYLRQKEMLAMVFAVVHGQCDDRVFGSK